MSEIDKSSDSAHLDFERVVFFSDAVFAIVITLLVLPLTAEFELPEGGEDFLHQLRELWPKILTFVVSFLVIGQFWMAHHSLFGWIERCDRGLVALNLLVLLTISVMPFPAAVLGAYGTDDDPWVRVLYAVGLALVSLSMAVLWWHARRRGLIKPALPEAARRLFTAIDVAVLVVFALSIVLAYLSFLAALVCWLIGIPVARRVVGRLIRAA